MSEEHQQEWNIEWILKNDENSPKFSILILNQPVLLDQNIACSLWKKADFRVTTDGGTDRWRHFIQTNNIDNLKPPEYITGDFDSVSQDTLDYFCGLGSKIIPTPDQNHTDFTKALMFLSELLPKPSKNVVVVIIESSGRLDQIFANINTLHIALNSFWKDGNIYLLASQSITWLLKPGRHVIRIPKEILELNSWCSLIPLNDPAIVTTTGLKWNLENQEMRFGGIVSTSNTYSRETQEVVIETSAPLIWSMATKKDK